MAELIIIGMGGHSKVVTDIARLNGYRILGYLDDKEPVGEERGLYLGRIETLPTWVRDGVGFVIAIGNNLVRKAIVEKYEGLELDYVRLVHPAAIIGSKVEILRGSVVMPGVIINADARIGRHVIVNTAAVIDHDCKVGDFAHIAQGAVLAGGVVVESYAVVEVGVRVGRGCVVGGVNTLLPSRVRKLSQVFL
ncbi:acetyltransferase [Desulfosporosinus sp. BICA1-9]|uniref:PglD-related sugar-binding protein n=1 Tax=Desulfosporosinus sp. BICA1-9 TaxID=1531958 RepID=UPI000A42E8D1|nr:acetyltransferase [Desulfosporosinus sp. BICA1-9]HBW35493.1 acetyltransferase [Desulfosporosinus sp.]